MTAVNMMGSSFFTKQSPHNTIEFTLLDNKEDVLNIKHCAMWSQESVCRNLENSGCGVVASMV